MRTSPTAAARGLRDPVLCRDLAKGCRILASQGLGDMIWGHASVRSEDPGVVLVKPHKIGLEEILPDDVIAVDLAGARIEGERPKHIETFIHTEIMRARPDVRSVVHVHAPSAVVLSALGARLLPIGHEGALFQRSLRTFDDTTDLIDSAERGRALAATLGDGDAVLLQNHGIVTAAATLEGAVLRAIFLEKACDAQLRAMAAGPIRQLSDEHDCDSKRRNLLSNEQVEAAYAYLARTTAAHAPCGCREPQHHAAPR